MADDKEILEINSKNRAKELDELAKREYEARNPEWTPRLSSLYDKEKPVEIKISEVTLPKYWTARIINRHLTFEEWCHLDKIEGGNAEVKRIACMRMGIEWFVKNGKPELVDVDEHSVNGQRMLMKVDSMDGLILACADPSTARCYYMSVPDTCKTCQEADAFLNHGLDQSRQVGRT